jgi:hypothetical protein
LSVEQMTVTHPPAPRRSRAKSDGCWTYAKAFLCAQMQAAEGS